MKKSHLSVIKTPALTIVRQAIKKDKCIYILVVNKGIEYNWKKSKIIYIGTTKNGASRIGESVVEKAEKALLLHGVNKIEAFIVSCRPRKKVKMWNKLESAFVLAFRGEYGSVPKYNDKFKKKKPTDEFDYFNKETIIKKLATFE